MGFYKSACSKRAEPCQMIQGAVERLDQDLFYNLNDAAVRPQSIMRKKSKFPEQIKVDLAVCRYEHRTLVNHYDFSTIKLPSRTYSVFGVLRHRHFAANVYICKRTISYDVHKARELRKLYFEKTAAHSNFLVFSSLKELLRLGLHKISIFPLKTFC